MADEIIGQIFSKDEADKNFGPVLSSVKISSSQLTSLCSRANKYVMFNTKGGILSILKEGKTVLHPSGFKVDANEKYAVYSRSKIEELLSLGKADTTFVERRKGVVSITNGQSTLEISDWCPPFCQ